MIMRKSLVIVLLFGVLITVQSNDNLSASAADDIVQQNVICEEEIKALENCLIGVGKGKFKNLSDFKNLKH